MNSIKNGTNIAENDRIIPILDYFNGQANWQHIYKTKRHH